MINLREFRRKWSWSEVLYWQLLDAVKETTKPKSFSQNSQPPETVNRHLLNSILEHDHYTNPSSWDCLLVDPICKGMISGDSVLGLWNFWLIHPENCDRKVVHNTGWTSTHDTAKKRQLVSHTPYKTLILCTQGSSYNFIARLQNQK